MESENNQAPEKPLEALLEGVSYVGTSLGEIIQQKPVQEVLDAFASPALAKARLEVSGELSKGTLYRIRKAEEKKLRKQQALLRRKKKQHYTVRRKKERAWEAKNRLPKRRLERFEKSLTPEGSWELLVLYRANRGVKVDITLEEWCRIYRECNLGRYAYRVVAYNPSSKQVGRYDIYVEDIDGGSVLYDGKEEYLRELGLIV